MSNEQPTEYAKVLFAQSEKTGGGPKTTMPVDSWLNEISEHGLVSIATFHGERSESSGYRSGEVHGQLRKVMTVYWYAYRVSEGQTYLFVSKVKKVFSDLGEANPTKWVEPTVTE